MPDTISEYKLNSRIFEMQEIEDALYELIPNYWITLEQLKLRVTNYQEKTSELIFNKTLIDGSQINSICDYFILDYYTKVQEGKKLNIIEQEFQKRKFQIAVRKIENCKGYELRKRIFKRLKDR